MHIRLGKMKQILAMGLAVSIAAQSFLALPATAAEAVEAVEVPEVIGLPEATEASEAIEAPEEIGMPEVIELPEEEIGKEAMNISSTPLTGNVKGSELQHIGYFLYGDTVITLDGNAHVKFFESGTLNGIPTGDLTIRGSGTLTVDGAISADAITIDSVTVNAKSFNHMYGAKNPGITLNNATVSARELRTAGPVTINGGTTRVEVDASSAGNKAISSGGLVRITNNANVTAKCDPNPAYYGEGIDLCGIIGTEGIEIVNSVVTATGYQGGLYSKGDIKIQNSKVTASVTNTTEDVLGRGISCSSLRITNGSVVTAKGSQYGIYQGGGTLQIADSSVDVSARENGIAMRFENISLTGKKTVLKTSGVKRPFALYGGRTLNQTDENLGLADPDKYLLSWSDWYVYKRGDSAGILPTDVVIIRYVALTGITLDRTSLAMPKGYKLPIHITITPANATNQRVSWSSSNPAVATVDTYGWVTAVADGTAVITATTRDGNKTATCKVTVGRGGGTWEKDSKGWWYSYAGGGCPKNKWEKISGKWYHFDARGYMQTGWLKDGGRWYYLESSGAMATGWKKVSGKWYYFNASGVMQTGWKKLSGKWYYFESSGAMLANVTKKIGSKYYTFNASGVCTNP